MRISFEQIDPAALLAELVDRAQEQAQTRGVELRASLPSGLPPIRADRQRIEQVVGNLLGNGIKFTGAGGTLVVSAAAEEPLLVVRVSDSGIGIPEQYLDHIFERFFQVAPGPATSGTGLGLAIAKQLIELHGGQIFVASTPGQGTTVTFTLPLWT
jgi:signal transduction histidine kinase